MTQPVRRRLWIDAERVACRNRGKRIVDVVMAEHWHQKGMGAACVVHGKARRAHRARHDVACAYIGIVRDAERQHAHAFVRLIAHGSNVFVIRIEYDGAPRRNRFDELRFRARDVFDRAEEFHVRLTNVRHDPDRRCGNRRHRLDLMQPAHADLDDSRLVLLAYAQKRQRKTDLVVEIRLCLEYGAERRKRRCCKIFRRRLAVRASDRDDGQREAHAPRVREPLIRHERVGHAQQRCADPSELVSRARARYDDAGRSLFRCLMRKILAIEAIPFEAEEERAFRDLSRVGHDACKRIGIRLQDLCARRIQHIL